MYETELKFSGCIFEVFWIEVDKQVSGSLGIIHSKVLPIISAACSSAFLERVRIYSTLSTVMIWDITGAVLGIQYL